MSRKIKKRSPRKIHFSPLQLESQLQKAFVLHKNGQLARAKEIYRSILSQFPDHSHALNLLGIIAQAEGQYKLAVKLAQKACASNPTAELLTNLGSALRGNGNHKKAISAFQKALEVNPAQFEAKFNLADTLLEWGKSAEAEKYFQEIVRCHPELIEAHEGLCQAYYNQSKHEEALNQSHKLIQTYPEHSNAYLQKGMALEGLKKLAEAKSAYEKAYELDHNQDVALNNIGNILSRQGDLHQAMAFYQRAVALKPDSIEASINLAWIYGQHGMLTESASCYQQIIKMRPDQYHIYSDLLFTSNYDPDITPLQHFDAAKKWWGYYKKSEQDASIPATAPAKKLGKAIPQKLKIGFLSPNFCLHPVGIFLLPLLQELVHHDIQIYCYAEMAPEKYDKRSSQIKEFSHAWFSTWHKSCAEVISQIKTDRLDILIDLAGHSAFNRLDIMAAKPVTVQAEWLGYVNTTGLPTIDYRLTDAITDPPGANQYYSEKLLRLPNGFFCYTPPKNAPAVNEAPILSRGAPTFGSLNNLAKITPRVIEVWAEILTKTPKSTLLMVSCALSDDFIKEKYSQLFRQHGIEPERIEMISTLPMQEYLAIYNKIDISLDTFPHNGHTISCHTLWMGVPIIVLRGEHYAGRMGASIMTRIGLDELIAEEKNQYVEIAVQLASSPDTIAKLRRGMRQKMLDSPICDHRQFAEDFIKAVQTMIS